MQRAKPATWKEYFENTKDNPPRPLLVKALAFVRQKDNALDLGAGALNDSKYLLSQGFKNIIAVDKFDVAAQEALHFPSEHFTYSINSFEKYDFPKERFDLINAQYALPFIEPNHFDVVFRNMLDSLKKGGIVTGQFFGDRDEWKNNPAMTFLSKFQANEYLGSLKVLSFEEEERDKKTARGEMKHWHVFHFIAERE